MEIDESTWTPVADLAEQPDRLLLDDLDLVADVTHPIRGAILRRLKRPRTVADLADALDVPITRLYHHVNRLTDLGLIRVVATRKVAAVTERRYQVAAKSFQIDDQLLTSTDERELSAALCSLFDVAKLGFQRFVESGGLRDIDADDERSALSLSGVQLSPDRRRALMRRIDELVDEFGSDVDDESEGSRVTFFVTAFEEPG